MSSDVAAIVPFGAANAGPAQHWADRLGASGCEVLVSGPASLDGQAVLYAVSKGDALRAAITRITRPYTVIVDPEVDAPAGALTSLLDPLRADRADAVWARRTGQQTPAALAVDRLLGAAAARGAGASAADPFSGLRAVRTEALRSISLRSQGEDVDAELAVKLAAAAYRVIDVPMEVGAAPAWRWRHLHERLRGVARYCLFADPADGGHEGYTTLHRMESAPRYNAWLAQKLDPHLGRRVVELGAGLGTMAAQLHRGRERYVALERDPFYVRRLRNRFRGLPHVEVVADDVAHTRWEALRSRRLDTVLLANVLEHVEDDEAAVAGMGRLLPVGGRVVILVPALPALFGELDRAVGHFRRYTPDRLRALLEAHRFSVEHLEWLNVLGIPGWLVNGKLLGRRSVPPLQLRLYDRLAPLLARVESRWRPPIGLSLLAVGRYAGEPG